MEKKRINSLGLFKVTLHAAMGLLYLIIGGMIIAYQWFMFVLQPLVAWALGIIIIAYGAFRIYRSYTLYKEES